MRPFCFFLAEREGFIRHFLCLTLRAALCAVQNAFVAFCRTGWFNRGFKSLYAIIYNKGSQIHETLLLFFGGEGGIRTLGTGLPYTHFPGVLLRPLGHLSRYWSENPSLYNFLSRTLCARYSHIYVRLPIEHFVFIMDTSSFGSRQLGHLSRYRETPDNKRARLPQNEGLCNIMSFGLRRLRGRPTSTVFWIFHSF